MRQNVELLAEAAAVAAAARDPLLITDVGGTKRDIVTAARRCRATSPFVGGHPIGGAERGGFGFARADLFKGRPWIFTPDASDAGVVADARSVAFVARSSAPDRRRWLPTNTIASWRSSVICRSWRPAR